MVEELICSFFNSNKFDELKESLGKGVYLLKLSQTRIQIYEITKNEVSTNAYLVKRNKRIGLEEILSDSWDPPILPERIRKIFFPQEDPLSTIAQAEETKGRKKASYLLWVRSFGIFKDLIRVGTKDKFYKCVRKLSNPSPYKIYINGTEYFVQRITEIPEKTWKMENLEEYLRRYHKEEVYGCDFYFFFIKDLELTNDEIIKVEPQTVSCSFGYLIDPKLKNILFITAYVPTPVEWRYKDNGRSYNYKWESPILSFPIKIEEQKIQSLNIGPSSILTCSNIEHPLVYAPTPKYVPEIKGTCEWWGVCITSPLRDNAKKRVRDITNYSVEVIFQDLEMCMKTFLSPRKEYLPQYLEEYTYRKKEEPPAVKSLRR